MVVSYSILLNDGRDNNKRVVITKRGTGYVKSICHQPYIWRQKFKFIMIRPISGDYGIQSYFLFKWWYRKWVLTLQTYYLEK